MTSSGIGFASFLTLTTIGTRVVHSKANLGTPYQKRISAPLLDRIDIHVQVLRVNLGSHLDCRRTHAQSN